LSTDLEFLEKQLGEFCCTKDPDIESYIRNKAISYECSGLSRTYLYLGGAGSDVEFVAYLTLAITSVSYSDIIRSRRSKVLRGKPGRNSQDHFPGILIGQLARDDRYDGSVIDGPKMIADAENLIEVGRRTLGGMLIYLDCKNELVKFYERNGYNILFGLEPENGLYKMFKPLPKMSE
jgi:hypothetical protein